MKSVDWGTMVYNSCRLQSLMAGPYNQTVEHHTEGQKRQQKQENPQVQSPVITEHMLAMCFDSFTERTLHLMLHGEDTSYALHVTGCKH